jgi:hypothetical protein
LRGDRSNARRDLTAIEGRQVVVEKRDPGVGRRGAVQPGCAIVMDLDLQSGAPKEPCELLGLEGGRPR